MKLHDLKIDHLAFPSFDPEETWRFYTEVMRMPLLEVLSQDGAEPMLIVSFGHAGQPPLVFFTVKDMEPPAHGALPDWIYHYAFSAPSTAALQDWRERLAKLGVPYAEEDHGGQRSLYFSDPNGLMLEVNYPPASPPPADAGRQNEAFRRMRRWTQTHLQGLPRP